MVPEAAGGPELLLRGALLLQLVALNEPRVVAGLPQAQQVAEHVDVARGGAGVPHLLLLLELLQELRRLLVQCGVHPLLCRGEVNRAGVHHPRRQVDDGLPIERALLGPPQHHWGEHCLQPPVALLGVLRDLVADEARERLVLVVRLVPQEVEVREEVLYRVLDRGPRKTPAPVCPQPGAALGAQRLRVLDHLGLIQDGSVPVHLAQGAAAAPLSLRLLYNQGVGGEHHVVPAELLGGLGPVRPVVDVHTEADAGGHLVVELPRPLAQDARGADHQRAALLDGRRRGAGGGGGHRPPGVPGSPPPALPWSPPRRVPPALRCRSLVGPVLQGV